MLNTLRGNVQSDPMRIPAPAAMSAGRGERFEDVLQEATAPRQRTLEAEPAQVADVDDAPTAPATAAAEPAAKRGDDAEHGGAAADEVAEEMPAAPGDEHAAAVVDGDANDLRRGESGWRETAGKGTDSPRPSKNGDVGQELVVATMARRGRQVGMAGGAGLGQPAAPAVAAAARAVAEPVRAIGPTTATAATAAAKAAATAPGYRTSGVVSAQLLDQARDSVFKQILFKISGEGGEVRMRLEPPDLGELDLHMVVEDGNRLFLSIAAERPELANLIQRHVQDLAATLQGSGLELVRADIGPRTDDGGRGAFGARADRGGTAAGAEDGAETITGLRSGGYVRADGLDYWV